MSVDGETVSSFEGSGSPVVSDYLKDTIPRALELGFKFTRMPRIGAPRLEISDEFKINLPTCIGIKEEVSPLPESRSPSLKDLKFN